MSLRRVFLLSAAALVSLAALIAIGAVLNGDFGETEVRILGRLATTFVAGSIVIAGLACLAQRRLARARDRRASRSRAAASLLWSAQIWGGDDGDG